MRHRPGASGGDIVLAREDELHRFFGDVGQNGGLDCGVRPNAPAVAAAQQLLVDLDLVRRGLEDAGDNVGGERAKLRAGPDFGRLPVLRDFSDAVHRLHLRVIAVFRPIRRFHQLRRAAQRFGGIADLILHHGLGIRILPMAGILFLGLIRVGVGRGSAGGIPLDLERVASGSRRFNGVADHGNTER